MIIPWVVPANFYFFRSSKCLTRRTTSCRDLSTSESNHLRSRVLKKL